MPASPALHRNWHIDLHTGAVFNADGDCSGVVVNYLDPAGDETEYFHEAVVAVYRRGQSFYELDLTVNYGWLH